MRERATHLPTPNGARMEANKFKEEVVNISNYEDQGMVGSLGYEVHLRCYRKTLRAKFVRELLDYTR